MQSLVNFQHLNNCNNIYQSQAFHYLSKTVHDYSRFSSFQPSVCTNPHFIWAGNI